MPNAPAIFSASAFTELIALGGRAKLSYPTADSPHFRVERAFIWPKAKIDALAFNQPDDEFPAALLKSIQRGKQDGQNVQVALRYETLPGLPLTQVTNSVIDMIPAVFRTAETYTTTTTRVDPSVPTTPDATSDTILSSTVQMETAVEGTKTNVTRPAGAYPTLTGYEVSDSTLGEKAANIQAINSTAAPSQGLFVISSTSTPLGNGNYLHTTLEFQNPPVWPVLTQNSLGGLQFIPPEFRASLSLTETRTKVDPATSPDALTGGVVESVVIPETKYRSERRTTSITGDYPTLVGHQADPGSLGVSAVVTKLLVADGTAPSLGYQILTSTVEPLGNGLSISTTKSLTWPTLTNQTLGSVDVIPEMFRSAIKLNEVVTRLDATTSPAPDALSDTVLFSTITQESNYLAIKRTTSLDSSTLPTLTGHEVSSQTLGESAQVVRSIVADGTAPATGFKVINSEVSTLGNGYSIKRTLLFDSGTAWPTLAQKQIGNIGLFPERFRSLMVTTETRSKVAPSTAPTGLSLTVLESEVIPETKDRSELRVTELASSSIPQLVGYEVSNRTLGEIAYVNESIIVGVSGGGSVGPDQGLNVVESGVTEIGNGRALLRTVLIDEDGWPAQTEKQIGGEQLIPAKFLAGLSVTTVKTKVDPSTAPTALSSTIIGSRVIPEGLNRSELQVSTLSSSTFPTLTGHLVSPLTWGANASVIDNVYTTGSGSDVPATGLNVLESRVEQLGNGKSQVTTTSLTWPAGGLTEKKLGGVDVIPPKFRVGAEFDTVRTKVAPSTSPTALSPTVFESEVVPETKDRSELRVTSLSGSFPTSFVGFELNAKGQSIGITEKLVADGTRPTLDASFESSRVEALGNGQSYEVDRNYLNVAGAVPADTFSSFRQTGGNAGAILEETVRSFIDASTAPTGFPNTAAYVISDEIIEDTVQRSIRVLKKLTDSSGSNPTLPVYYVEKLEYDRATNTPFFRSHNIVAATATLPLIGVEWPPASSSGMYVANARIVPAGAPPYFSVNAIQEVEYSPIPQPWVEYPMVGMEFPALFKFADHYAIDPLLAYYSGFPPPWPGDGTTLGTYQLIAHRQARRQARRLHTYTLGPSNATPSDFKVITPGISSKFFSIPPNCIHAPIKITGTDGSVSYPIETIPASSPSTYLTTQILVHSCEERRIFGNIYERILTEISEETPPSQFGDIFAAVSFTASDHPKIDAQPDSAGETLWLISTNAGDTQTCIVYGRRGATVIRERIALTGTTFVQTANKFQRLYHLHVGSAPAGDVSIHGSGIPQSGYLDFNGITIADGDTVQVGRTGATQTYRFKTTMAAANDIQRVLVAPGPTLNVASTLINLALAVNGAGVEGAAGSGAPYFTGTAATANIVSSIDATDNFVIHFADATDLQTNSRTYVLTPAFAGTAPTVAVFGGSHDGPELAVVTNANGLLGKIDAYQVEYLNNPGLLDDTESIPVTGVSQVVVSASSDGSSTIVSNVPATVHLISDPLPPPLKKVGSVYSLVMCLAGTPAITPTYQISTDGGATWGSGAVSLPAIGNGKVFTALLTDSALVSPTSSTFIRVKVDNTGSNLARAIHIALRYQVPT